MNVNESGVIFRFGLGFDISANTSLSITFTKPSGALLTVTNPAVTVGASTITTTLGQFLINEWASYTFAPGDVDEAGAWTARLTYVDGSKSLISAVAAFTIAA